MTTTYETTAYETTTDETAFQGSLLDGFDDVPRLSALEGRVERIPLSEGAWVDVLPGWLQGSDGLFLRLVGDVPWRAERRQMYDRVVDVPRLLAYYGDTSAAASPHPGRVRCRPPATARLVSRS
jgi:alkylated DNA repair dioxygenase AlkB